MTSRVTVPESLDEIPPIQYDYAITMGCGDECPYVAARQREDWKLPDPKHLGDERISVPCGIR